MCEEPEHDECTKKMPEPIDDTPENVAKALFGFEQPPDGWKHLRGRRRADD